MDFYTKVITNVAKFTAKLNHKSNPLLPKGILPDTAESKCTLLHQLDLFYAGYVYGMSSDEFAHKCQNRQISVQEGRNFMTWAKLRLGNFEPNMVGQLLASKIEIFEEIAFNEHAEQQMFEGCANDLEEKSRRVADIIKQVVVQPTQAVHDSIPTMPKVRTYSLISALGLAAQLQSNKVNPTEFKVTCLFYEVEPREIRALAQWVTEYFGQIDFEQAQQ